MHKQECVHVHGLLVEVAGYLIERDAMEPVALARYEGLGTRPTSIHESKQDHKAAILVLGRAIEAAIERPDGESPDQLPG